MSFGEFSKKNTKTHDLSIACMHGKMHSEKKLVGQGNVRLFTRTIPGDKITFT